MSHNVWCFHQSLPPDPAPLYTIVRLVPTTVEVHMPSRLFEVVVAVRLPLEVVPGSKVCRIAVVLHAAAVPTIVSQLPVGVHYLSVQSATVDVHGVDVLQHTVHVKIEWATLGPKTLFLPVQSSGRNGVTSKSEYLWVLFLVFLDVTREQKAPGIRYVSQQQVGHAPVSRHVPVYAVIGATVKLITQEVMQVKDIEVVFNHDLGCIIVGFQDVQTQSGVHEFNLRNNETSPSIL